MTKELESHPQERLPKHVVLIPDGNGRWAAENGKPVSEGHRKGAQAVEAFLRACRDTSIPYASVWAFSTENWARSSFEISAIMRLVEAALQRNRGKFKRDGIRFRHIGRKDRIREQYSSLAMLMDNLETETADNGPFNLNLALDYGGRDETIRAIQKLMADGLAPEDVSWEQLEKRLDTAGIPDPDLILRTSGERRLSGILPLQGAYAEMVFANRFLPAMKEEDFHEMIRSFSQRERRFGGRSQNDEALNGVSENE